MKQQNHHASRWMGCFSIVIALASTDALAYRHGDFALRLGGSLSSPNDKSSGVYDEGVGDLNSRVVVNTRAGAQMGLMYMFTDWIGFDMNVSTPYRHRVTARDYSVSYIGLVDVIVPMFNFQIYPAPCDSVFQPYLGVGGHYANYSKQRLSSQWVAAWDTGRFDINNHFSWNGQLGMDIALNDNWFLNMSASYLDVQARTKINETTSGDLHTYLLHIDPVVYNLGVSLKF